MVNSAPVCVFCSSNNTLPLTQDGGSFRHCNSCKKHFKAKLAGNNLINRFTGITPYKTTN